MSDCVIDRTIAVKMSCDIGGPPGLSDREGSVSPGARKSPVHEEAAAIIPTRQWSTSPPESPSNKAAEVEFAAVLSPLSFYLSLFITRELSLITAHTAAGFISVWFGCGGSPAAARLVRPRSI